MLLMRMTRIMALAMLPLLGAQTVAHAQDSTKNPVVATVDGHQIRLNDVREARDLLPVQLQGLPFIDVYPMLVDSLIGSNLSAAKAKKLGFDETPEYKQNMARISERLLERMLLTRHIEAAMTDELLRTRYQQMVKRAKDQYEVRGRHVLVKERSVADALIEMLGEGADFAELAKNYSLDTTADNGGDLGWFGPGRMLQPFEDAAMALPVGTYTETPVRTQYGWHVILVEERRPYSVPSFDTVRPILVSEMSTELGKGLMADLRKDAQIDKMTFEELNEALK